METFSYSFDIVIGMCKDAWTLRRYKRVITALTTSMHMVPTCVPIHLLQSTLPITVNRGIEKQYGKDVALGVSFILAQAWSSEYAIESNVLSIKRAKSRLTECVDEIITFLMSYYQKGVFRKKPRRSRSEYDALIRRLVLKLHNELPI